MFDLCPPFQIDGNLGGPAAITEMLIQSTPNEITILPALPQQWPNGDLTGVRVRGGGKADIVWKDGRLVRFAIQSSHAIKYHVSYGGQAADVQTQPGRVEALDSSLHAIKN